MFRKLEDNYYIPFKEMLGKSKEKKRIFCFQFIKQLVLTIEKSTSVLIGFLSDILLQSNKP